MMKHHSWAGAAIVLLFYSACFKDEAPELGVNLLDNMDPRFISVDSVKVTGTAQKDLVFYLRNDYDQLNADQHKQIVSLLAEINILGISTERLLKPDQKTMAFPGRKTGEKLVLRFAYNGVGQQVSNFSAPFTYIVP